MYTLLLVLNMKDRCNFYPLTLAPPGFVRGIQIETTHSSIKVLWSVPTTKTGKVMGVDHYHIYYVCGIQEISGLIESVETQCEISNLAPLTYTFITINAVDQGKIGPQVFIGISTGNIVLDVHLHVSTTGAG